ncbi:N-acetylmannosamine-6-phosphate 2-epimerase [Neobacillus sp.]|uniref:N-acetylmannosamine-6-phosphate 2-epimerase n=1 Tax=Neobacillus sp. TaxID=2675273 RepID=UPI00289DA087|nr:N-acetylmannosamine-6-phosphate 2-epimerase [Neobacillus sp.]
MNIEQLQNQMVVSCQAQNDHPLNHPDILARLALCAEKAGAVAIRADHPVNIKEIKKVSSLPVIGIYKVPTKIEGRYFITPTFEHAEKIVEAGADIVAIEATFEYQPDDEAFKRLLTRIQTELKVPVMADVSTLKEGERAWKFGAELVATTLSGYTKDSKNQPRPDFPLLESLALKGIRTVCEGHIRTPSEAKKALEHGAYFVVVGTAITDPVSITSWFVEACQ